MRNKYIVVRGNSTSGPYIVERNEMAPRVNTRTLADVAGYADTVKAADELAARVNEEDAEEEDYSGNTGGRISRPHLICLYFAP